MINYSQDNSCVTPLSRGVILSTVFRGSLRAVPPLFRPLAVSVLPDWKSFRPSATDRTVLELI
ncbi:hypothetical protein SH449x_000731 [Pirellulaceae bacterium SH449]